MRDALPPVAARSHHADVALLLGCPLHFAGIEIVIAFDNADLSSDLTKFSLLSNLSCDLGVIFVNSIR
jgi:hypothetical protein